MRMVSTPTPHSCRTVEHHLDRHYPVNFWGMNRYAWFLDLVLFVPPPQYRIQVYKKADCLMIDDKLNTIGSVSHFRPTSWL